MSARLVETKKAQPYQIGKGEINTFSACIRRGRRETRLYTNALGEQPVSNFEDNMILWGGNAFTAARDIASAQETTPTAAGRTPIGLSTIIRFIDAATDSKGMWWKQVASINPYPDTNLHDEVSNLRPAVAGPDRHYHYVLRSNPSNPSLPVLLLGDATLHHETIVGDRDPQGVLDAGTITMNHDESGNYTGEVSGQGDRYVAPRSVGGKKNRQLVGEAVAAMMQLVNKDNPSVTISLQSPETHDWGVVTTVK